MILLNKKLIPRCLVLIYIDILISIKKFKNRKKGVNIKKGVTIDLFSIIEEHTVIGKFSQVDSSHIGFGTYISDYSSLLHTKIGKFCSIADNVRSGIGSHPTNTFVSTHPSFFSTTKQAGFTLVTKNRFEELKKIKNSNFVVEIGNDVWIGSGVKILDGIKIGNGAIIGANAVVTKDIEPYTINVGVPAKPIKKRFNDAQIEFLELFKWWDKDFEWIKENSHHFNNIEIFIKTFSSRN